MSTRIEARWWWAFAVMTLLGALVGCGGGDAGGGGDEEAPPLQGQFFPLAVGDRWVYAVDGANEATVQATATRLVNGQEGIVVVTDDPVDGRIEEVYVVSSAGVSEVPASGGDPLLAAIGSVDVMRFPLHTGDTFVQVDKTIDTGADFDGDGRQDTAAVHSEVQVVGLEVASTPLGAFAGSLHLRTTVTATVRLSGLAQSIVVTITADDWYAPDIGPVRSVIASSSQGITETQTMALVAYRVGARRSETVAPTVVSVSPADGGVQGPGGTISVTFSEPMDTLALATAFTLTDPAGLPLPATVRIGGNTATLVPALGLGAGRYVAQVATSAVDLAGNPLAAVQRWSFDVDATGPVLVDATPAEGAIDVAPGSSIVLRFNEPIEPASLNANLAMVSGSGVDVPFAKSVNGSVLTLTPTTPLVRAERYEVHVFDSLSDLVGNRMNTDVLVHFRVDTGRFALPVAMAAEGLVDAVAVGDVNGDGRADVLFTGGYTAPPAQQFKLMIRLQQADGNLAPHQVLDTRAEYVCPASSIAIGDLDGDGRNDLVLGASGCGIQVFRQGADGVLRAAEFIDSPQSGRLRLADLNRDGRLDLIAAGGYGTALAVWLQAADGTMVLHATPAFEYYGVDLDVGDVNGDGRPDIVVTSNSGNPDQSIGIVLQRADGSFAPAQARTAVPAMGVSAVAVGDVNGDGRDDVVVTYGGNGGRLGVMLQQGDGSLGPVSVMSSYDSPNQAEVIDVNGDGRPDVVVGHSGWYAIGVYMQQTDGTLAAEARYPANYGNNNPGSLALGDVNGDGRPDVVVAEALLRQRVVDMQAQSVPRPGAGIAGVMRRALGVGAPR